jgi:hypothetical protein
MTLGAGISDEEQRRISLECNPPTMGMLIKVTQREKLLADTLLDILKLAQDCRSDAQGRLADDEHHRMFLVLGSIQNRASVALS